MGITLTDIARAAGVSLATASRALTNSAHPMSEETRQRIQKIAREAGYQPNLLARSLRTDRTHTVGIIIENVLSPFIPPIVRGIQDSLKPAGYLGIIINSDWDPEIEIETIHALNRRQIDGLIFVESWHRSSEAVQQMTNKPFVFVHRLFNGHCANSVVVDERAGARLATSHLAGLGHRRIAYTSGPQDWDASKNRLEGYRDELAVRGFPFDGDLVVIGDWEINSGYEATRQLMLHAEPPTAIFAGNDLMALGAIYALQDRGLRIPQDVAVVGYDDRNFTGLVRPAITSVSMPCYDMGVASTKLLLNLIADEIETAEPIEIRGQLMVRESCGASHDRWKFQDDPGALAWRSRRINLMP